LRFGWRQTRSLRFIGLALGLEPAIFNYKL
jgi:hypothetical protein